MRHVTDGELHAYLDGALDLLPEDRGDEIREHLEGCSVCAERLAEEERVRDRAQELLAGTAPTSVALPSFEELRAQAEAGATNEDRLSPPALGRTPSRRPLPGIPLAWAATVILALGVGWMGGQLRYAASPGGRPDASDAESLDPRGPPPLEPAVGADRAIYEIPEEGRVEDNVARGEARNPQEEPGPQVAAPPSAAMESIRARMAEVPLRELESRVPTLQSQAVTGVLPDRGGEVVQGARASLTQAPATPEADLLVGSALREKGIAEGGSLAVPGLKVISVSWEEWVPGEEALHIRQLLSERDTLELRYLGLLLGTDPEAGGRPEGWLEARRAAPERPLSPAVLEASLPRGWNQVEMRWGRGWLVARAPLPKESIRMLLRSIQ